MKVLDLRCEHDHRFEGWFGSEADFVSQDERHLVECPVCGSHAISRLPSAPRLSISGAREVSAPVAPAQSDLQVAGSAAWMNAMRQMLAQTEDVGARFPEEARKIHYGEVPERAIRGQASREQADALREEGIEVLAVSLPVALKGSVQ